MGTIRTALPVSLHACSGGDGITVVGILFRVNGVQTVYLNPATEMAYVEFDPALTSPPALFEIIKQAGFAPAAREGVRFARSSGVGLRP